MPLGRNSCQALRVDQDMAMGFYGPLSQGASACLGRALGFGSAPSLGSAFAFVLRLMCAGLWGFIGGPAMAQRADLSPVFLQIDPILSPIDEPATSVFLTFDDGPHQTISLAIIDVLEKYGAYGNFFVVGDRAQRSWGLPILQRLSQGGHLVANHTFEHSTSYANESALEASLRLTTQILRPYLPPSDLVFFRSPGGIWNQSRARWTNLLSTGAPDLEFATYVGPIYWNVGGDKVVENGQVLEQADWLCWKNNVSPRACADGYIAKIKSNHARGVASIVLMHDLDQRTAEMLDFILFDLTLDPTPFQFKSLDMAIWPFAHQQL